MSATIKNTLFNLINHKETNIIVTACLLFISLYIALAAILDRNVIDPMAYMYRDDTFEYFNESDLHVPRVSPPEYRNESDARLINAASRDAIDQLTPQGYEKEPSIYGRFGQGRQNEGQNEGINGGDLFNVSNDPFINQSEPQVEVIRYGVDQRNTLMSLFFLWIVALFFGRITSYLYLPPLLGMLLAGIMIRNIDVFSYFWQIDASIDQILRQFAFILILIRCGVNLEPDAVRQSLTVFTSLGFLSTTAEATAVVLAAHFLLAIPLATAILFGFILTATSPAVTIPAIIRLQEKGYGRQRGIPTMVLASVSIDNIYCITAFMCVGSVVFTRNEDLVYLIVRIPIEILMGALVGILIGLLLRIFPRSDVDLAHFIRSVFICSASVAVLFGTDAIGCYMAGPVSVFLLCVISSMRWKVDNHQSTRKEEHCYRIFWDLIFQPFLFALIGLLFDFSQMSWQILWNAVALIFIGVAVRWAFVLIMTFFMRFEAKEKLFISLCFLPKASVQAALAPLIFQYQTFDATPQQMEQIFQTCVLSILITAPIGQLIIELFGKLLLNKHVEVAKRNIEPLPLPGMPPSYPSHFPPPPSLNKKSVIEDGPEFHISDADNRLRLKVNGSMSKKGPQHQSTFEEINKQAYEIFKEQRIGGGGKKLGVVDEITSVRPLNDANNDKPSTKF